MKRVLFGTLVSTSIAIIPVLTLAQSMPPLNKNPAAVQAGAYSVEPLHTRVLFSVSHLGFTTWYGEFTHVSGTLTLNPKMPDASKLNITIPVDTISTSNATLDGELRSPAWFDAAKYPAITFKSMKIARTGPETASVSGELTFHGVTKPEVLKVTFNASGIDFISHQYTVGFNATADIKRSAFNQTTYVPAIGDDVSLMISAAFVKP